MQAKFALQQYLGAHRLATKSVDGRMTVWDLEERKLISTWKVSLLSLYTSVSGFLPACAFLRSKQQAECSLEPLLSYCRCHLAMLEVEYLHDVDSELHPMGHIFVW